MTGYTDLYYTDPKTGKVSRHKPHTIDAHDAVRRFPNEYSLKPPKPGVEVENLAGPEFVADTDEPGAPAPADPVSQSPKPRPRTTAEG